MAKKKNQDLRPDRDALTRKKVNGSTGWTKYMLESLSIAEAETEATKPMKKRKSKTNNAKRLTSTSL